MLNPAEAPLANYNFVKYSYLASAALSAVAAGAGGLLVAAGVAMGGADCAEVLLVAALGTPIAAEGATAGAVPGALAGPIRRQDQSEKVHPAYQHV